MKSCRSHTTSVPAESELSGIASPELVLASGLSRVLILEFFLTERKFKLDTDDSDGDESDGGGGGGGEERSPFKTGMRQWTKT